MDKPRKLADLKLVNKYYPIGVANFSYPSPQSDSMSQCDRLVGRSSVGSEASVPDMVDDRDSIISTDEDDKSFYHVSGADIWDKFWDDPFWEANAEEAERDADGDTQRILTGKASYPASIPSPRESRTKDQDLKRNEGVPLGSGARPSFPRPLRLAESLTSRSPVTPKVAYSLFPRQTLTPPATLSPPPRRLDLTPRSKSLWGNPAFNDSTTSLNSLGRSSRVRKTRSDVTITKGRSSWTASPIVAPVPTFPLSPAFAVTPRRDSSQPSLPKQRFPVRPTRTRSSTLVSQTSTTSAPRIPSIEVSPKDKPIPPRPTTECQTTPRSTRFFSGRFSQPDARRIPPPLQLQRCATETEAPPPPPPPAHQRTSRATSHGDAPTSPSTPPTMPAHPPQPPPPMPVSFFDVDSDSDAEEEEQQEASFARRIARSFTSQVRSRSASAAPRSRKGQDVAKLQLRRARAETVGSPAEEEEEEDVQALTPAVPRVDDKSCKESRPPMLRKQKSEVFGKIFWNRR